MRAVPAGVGKTATGRWVVRVCQHKHKHVSQLALSSSRVKNQDVLNWDGTAAAVQHRAVAQAEARCTPAAQSGTSAAAVAIPHLLVHAHSKYTGLHEQVPAVERQ